ncbi:MAG: hypothetical protein DCF19_15135 [Pseudanabaena frigida]|uniref:Circadian input-output histidine kinase CikA n=1 Tax=Pseudanabaena frigida TaxID=945775 RepID=A0A2W4W6S1_9CYAN|nr:MAG: hypothetical protein DCF19_15135 [Pseudanabaena frigida]
MPKAKTILIVDDCESDRVIYHRYLQHDPVNSYSILEAQTIQQAIQLWRLQKPDVTLVDFNLTDGNGLEFLESIRAIVQENSSREIIDLKLPVIMLTGHGDERIAVNAMKLGASDYLIKNDITEFTLCQSIHSVLDRITLNQKLKRLQRRELLVSQIALNIRQFLNLEDICQAIVQEIRKFIKADRTVIYKFNEDMGRRIISEALASPWQSCSNAVSEENCLSPSSLEIEEYKEGKIRITSDIYNANFSECHVQMLESFQVKANVVVPILLSRPLNNDPSQSSQHSSQFLWGLLIVHQCSAPRIWEDEEIQLLQQLSVQLAIAIQQAEIHQNLQLLNSSLERQVQERTAELQASEFKMRSILNSMPDIINFITADGIYIESILNNVAYDIVPSHINRIGKHLIEILPAEIAIPQFEAVQQAIATGEMQTLEQSFRINDYLKYEEVRVVPVREDAVIVVVRDVSDRKHAEENLRASEARLQKIAKSSPGIIQIFVLRCDGSACFEYLSSAFEEINELTVEEVMNNPQLCFDQIHINDIANLWEALGYSIETLSTFRHEWRIVTPSGKIKWLKANLRPERRENGDFALYGVVSDISNRKHAEEELQIQYQRSQLIAEVTLEIRQSLNIEEILQMAVAGVKRILQADRVLALQLNDDGSSDVLSEAINAPFQSLIGMHIEMPSFYDEYKRQFLLGNCIKVDNVDIDSINQEHTDFLRQLGIKSHVTIPIVQTGNPWGLLIVDQCDRYRQWNDFEIDLMQQIANQVAIALTQSQLIAALQKSEEKRRLATDLSQIGCWELDVKTGKANWSENHFKLMGLDICDSESSYLTWHDRVHPDDLEWVENTFNDALENHTLLEIEYRIVYPQGDIHWVVTKGRGIYDSAGNALRMVGVMFDISDRKQIEIALEQEVIRNKMLLNNSFDGIFILDSEGNIIETNPSLVTILGYTIEEITNLSIYDIDVKWTREELAQGIREFKSGKRAMFETRYLRKDGSIRNVEISANSFGQGDDVIQFCICRDITQRKLAEEKLRKQEQEVRTLIENAPDIICRFDRDLRYTYINPVIESIIGLSPENFIGKSNRDLEFPNNFVDFSNQSVERVFTSGEMNIVEFKYAGSDATKYFQSRLMPEFDANGVVVSVIAISRDFTEQKLAEQELRLRVQREQMLNQFIQTIRSSLDLQIIFNAATQAIVNLLDLKQSGIVQYLAERKVWKHIAVFRNPIDVVEPFEIILEIPDHGNPFAERLKRMEIIQVNDTDKIEDEINKEIAKRKSGAWLLVPIIVNEKVWGSFSLVKSHKVVLWEDDEIELTQTIANQLAIAIQQATLYQQLQLELAERKQTEVELAQAKELAEAANKAKSAFLANMSHEIRTPMNGVLGMAQLLANTPLNDEQKDFVSTILDSGDLLITVINDILDFSKIESGNLHLETKDFNFTDTLISACNLLSKEASDKNISLQYQVNCNIASKTIGDSSRLRQIFINLIGNAIKFTERGFVSITVDGEFITANTYKFRCAIADTGVGIDCDRINNLFKPFAQADASINRKFGGTGLGLAICKRLVELMDGTVWVESRGVVAGNPPPDWFVRAAHHNIQGSTFYFTVALPLASQNQLNEKHDSLSVMDFEISPERLPIKILVVEDNILNQKIARLMLQRLGYEADVVENGHEFLVAMSDQQYDLVFMDVQMPVIDGLTATKTIRENLISSTKPWIVALTADALPADHQDCIDAGMNDYISKPFTLKEIERAISDYSNAVSIVTSLDASQNPKK